MTRSYKASIDNNAALKLALLHLDRELAGGCQQVLALVAEYQPYGPIVLDLPFEQHRIKRLGRFSCGVAYQMLAGGICVTMSVSDDDQELIVVDAALARADRGKSHREAGACLA